MKLSGKIYIKALFATVCLWFAAFLAYEMFSHIFYLGHNVLGKYILVSFISLPIIYLLIILYAIGYLKTLKEGNSFTREYNMKHANVLSTKLDACSEKLKANMKLAENNPEIAYKNMMTVVSDTNTEVELYLCKARAHNIKKTGFKWRRKTVYKVDDKNKKIWCDIYVASDRDIKKIYEYVAKGYELISENDGPYRTLPMARLAFPAKRND